MKEISFLHAADLHLDSPFKGLTHIPDAIFLNVQESTFIALDNLVLTAITKEVDFVLLVGDLFDNERQSLKAQVHLRTAFEKLQKHHIHVYLSYGNHDFINGNIHPITYPKNVHIFPNENISSFTFEKENQKIASIYGFSYENKAVTTNKSLQYSITNEKIPFHIATLHGAIHGNQEHDPYAPFRLSDLQETNFDYWALGHIHKREKISEYPPVVYPGNIQGRHRNESGKKGCYHVTLKDTDAQLEFVPLQAIQFDAVTVDVTHCKTVTEIEEKLVSAVKHNQTIKLIHVIFFSETQYVIELDHDGVLQELIDITNEAMITTDIWAYIYNYRLELDELPVVDYGEFFIGEIIESLEILDSDEMIRDLYTHPQGRRFLEKIPADELKERAKQYLLYELLKVKR